jgi:hypothetical protein
VDRLTWKEAADVTRYRAGTADLLTLAILRWGVGFLCVLPMARQSLLIIILRRTRDSRSEAFQEVSSMIHSNRKD